MTHENMLFRCLFVQMPTFCYHHSTISSHIAQIPLHLDPLLITWTQHTMLACLFLSFFFFFKIHPYTDIDVLFSNPHWETWQYVNFFLCFFDVFFNFLFFFFIKDRLCTYRCYMPPADPVGCWHGTVYSYLSGKQKEKKQHERPRYWEDEKVRQNKRSTDQTTCSCAWNGIRHYFWSNKMHAQTVCSVTQTTRLHLRGQDFLSTTCSVLD